MTVKELKQLLATAPDEMKVYINEESALGGFLFKEACKHESGIAELPEPDESTGEFGNAGKIFIVMAHGSTVTEDQIDESENPDTTALN